jgi:NAD(P)-dependent dehydrogenase (short-subunit alcohol dehydrogenase family)
VTDLTDASSGPVIVVTGANRGIGFEICRQLATRGARVVLTARKAAAGKAAVKKLAGMKLAADFQPLDVTDAKSTTALREYLQDTYGRLDVLINNAGVMERSGADAVDVDLKSVRATLETNTLGPLHLTQALLPLLKRSKTPRIVNMSSGMAQLSDNSGGDAAYRISKTALNAVTVILAAELRGAVAVNTMSPGWVRTDMGGPNADLDVADGADAAVWLALDAPQKLTGKFVRDRDVIPW